MVVLVLQKLSSKQSTAYIFSASIMDKLLMMMMIMSLTCKHRVLWRLCSVHQVSQGLLEVASLASPRPACQDDGLWLHGGHCSSVHSLHLLDQDVHPKA